MIVIGLSGGVDSSVAAWLLRDAGLAVRGVHMHNWEPADGTECRAKEDRMDALRVASSLNLPCAVWSFVQEYRQDVFQHFLDGYAQGWTPNPDILCNREVKFKAFLNRALNEGATAVATGHYARRVRGELGWELHRAVDASKDQSYFLHAITQRAVDHARFPLGELTKMQVREHASRLGLCTAKKKDSTGICFIGEQDFQAFLAQYLPAKPGEVVDQDGRVVGEHQGVWYYTVGQRAPLGGVKGFTNHRWYVAGKQVRDNRLVVVPDHDHPSLFTTSFVVDAPSWIAGSAPADRWDGEVQVRHLGEAHPASFVMDRDTNRLQVTLHNPVRAVVPGQSAVVYAGTRCFGGGVILPH